MRVVSQELLRLRQEIVMELAVARNYLQTMTDCVQALAIENNQLVGNTTVGDRMTQDLQSAATHLDQAYVFFSEASRIAQTLSVYVEVPDLLENDKAGKQCQQRY